MIGHLQIIEARKNRMTPTCIFVEYGYEPVPARYEFQKAENQIAIGSYPFVTITPEEMHQRHDLRFCTGCRVLLNGKRWDDDFLNFAEQIVRAGASGLVCYCPDDGTDLVEYREGNWTAYAKDAA